ncbi:MAG: hypothetical protein VX265_08955, partial [Myxococcota bacterium]|nr:hypothetical protein [Myxococcota bacterium]MEC8424089.1 hypothetical protein [Myxococcota bacterium]
MDACWTKTGRIERFAPALGEPGEPLDADVRVAWSRDGQLLLRVEGLPDGASLELGLSPAPDDDTLRLLWPAEVGPGIHRIAVQPALAPGTHRALRLAARIPMDDGGISVLPWAPAGPGDPHRAGVVAVLEAPGPDLGLRVEASRDGIKATAPGATRVRIQAHRTPVPRGSRGVPPPWSTVGEDRVQGAPPAPGWFTIEAVWHDDAGRLLDLTRQRTWWAGPPPPLAIEGLHPVPKAWAAGRGSGWAPEDGDRICAPDPSHAAAAALLAAEVRRFTSRTLVVARRGRCAIRFEPLDGLAAELPAGAVGNTMAFGVRVDPTGARLGVQDDRTATWAALALADLVGPDGVAPAAALVDWPDVDQRVLYHALNLRARPGWSASTHAAFLRRVVARGRYTDLVITPYDSFELPGVAGPTPPHARPTADLQSVIAAARALGIRVWPGVTGLAHAWWLTSAEGFLADDTTGEL